MKPQHDPAPHAILPWAARLARWAVVVVALVALAGILAENPAATTLFRIPRLAAHPTLPRLVANLTLVWRVSLSLAVLTTTLALFGSWTRDPRVQRVASVGFGAAMAGFLAAEVVWLLATGWETASWVRLGWPLVAAALAWWLLSVEDVTRQRLSGLTFGLLLGAWLIIDLTARGSSNPTDPPQILTTLASVALPAGLAIAGLGAWLAARRMVVAAGVILTLSVLAIEAAHLTWAARTGLVETVLVDLWQPVIAVGLMLGALWLAALDPPRAVA